MQRFTVKKTLTKMVGIPGWIIYRDSENEMYALNEEKGIDVTQKIDSESIDFLYNFKYDPSAEDEMKLFNEYDDDELDALDLDLDLDLDPEYEDFDFSLESFGKRNK